MTVAFAKKQVLLGHLGDILSYPDKGLLEQVEAA